MTDIPTDRSDSYLGEETIPPLFMVSKKLPMNTNQTKIQRNLIETIKKKINPN